VTAARELVEARDPRGVSWLVEHFADEDLVDWSPFIESPRPTRLEAARALWRAANRRFEYRGAFFEKEWRRDLAIEETRRFRAWWSEAGPEGFDAWFEEGCRLRGVDLGTGENALRRLARVLAEDHPRFFKENALDQLRRRTGEAILPVDIVDLEVLAPGEDHPIFPALSWRWLRNIEDK
jgi:hypothetical protein